MKILHVIVSADPSFGGPIEGVRQRGLLLKEWGHTVEVASSDDPATGLESRFPLKLYALGPGQGPLQYSAKLRDWLKENAGNCDAIVLNGLWFYFGIGARKAALASKKPYWVFTHGMLDPWFNRTYPLKKLKKMAFWPWQHPVLRDAEAVLFTCEEEKILARESFRPYQVRERVVNYGTGNPPGDTGQNEAFRAAHPQLQGKPYLLYMSRIHPKKGGETLLPAFAKAMAAQPELQLVIAGPSEPGYLETLKSLAAAQGIADRCHWPGMLQGELKYGALFGCEAFVLPSHQENFGIAIVEALACAKPVLITRPVNI